MDYFDYIVLTVAAVVPYWQGLGIKFQIEGFVNLL